MRVATYNIKHGGLKGPEAIAGVLSAIDADLVGLQEVDVGVRRSGGIDEAELLARLAGREVAFGAAFPYEGGHYGVALLSRWPIRSVETLQLPSLAEQRALLVAEVAHPDGLVTAAVTHFGLDPVERLRQARTVAERLRGLPRVVLFGDFNASYSEPSLAILAAELRDSATSAGLSPLRSYPADAPTIGIDHILVGGGLGQPLRVEAVGGDASDHLPVVVDLG
ncbi:endonuclease/exonuclease/phosphatase family protein [Vulgatibacter sp.]|uniref:endonuclease/exonuclease/phosphatase family protein n=1 Tax=Vulgatibacter sp. TaxID=1971226 RepID=UPI00356AD003